MEALKQNQKRIISLKKAKNLLIILVFVFFFDFFLFPMPVLANDAVAQSLADDDILKEEVVLNSNQSEITNNLPENDIWQVKSISMRVITAYNSEVGQTDDSPCITANGFDVCSHGQEDTIAANFLFFGTKVRIPGLFGDRVFVVRDRMNERYANRVDVWMINKQEAKQFGVKFTEIEILE